jgi:hypothetical protein
VSLLPVSKSSWLTEGWDAARAELDARLASAPL